MPFILFEVYCVRFFLFLCFDAWHRSSAFAEGLLFLCPSCFYSFCGMLLSDRRCILVENYIVCGTQKGVDGSFPWSCVLLSCTSILFTYVMRTFSHWMVVRRLNTQWKGKGKGFYRGFPSYGPCVFGLLAYPRGNYFCKELCGSVPLAIQSQDCYSILLLSSHYARGDVAVLWQFQELLRQRPFRDGKGRDIYVPSLSRVWLPHPDTSLLPNTLLQPSINHLLTIPWVHVHKPSDG